MKRLILLLLIPIVAAQTIDLKQIGFGQTQKEILFSLTNIGSQPITNPEIYLDGQLYQKLDASIYPGKTLNFIIFTEQGNHRIDVSYNNRNYSLEFTSIYTEPVQTEQKKSNKWLIFLLVITPFLLAIYLLLKKAKFKLNKL
ncbi:MAG: hypothetical protein QXM68_04235 [Candidatus Aenigmatarchaeota archaeon]|nr:hypothetical protein [Candidatus Aenigmarchaeota archaeon]